jgi:hypothetical protein
MLFNKCIQAFKLTHAPVVAKHGTWLHSCKLEKLDIRVG